jgi:FxLD family lantipeptide
MDDFELDVRLVEAGSITSVIASEDCTNDGCGSTPGSAGIFDC